MPIGDTKEMDIQDFIRKVGDHFGVPEFFRNQIFGIESGGRQYGKGGGVLTSPKGALGAGQLMPDTAKGLGVNPHDPAENIWGSLKLQKQLIDKYTKITGNQTKAYLLAAAAYNAGEGAVEKHGGIPPYAETQNYVKKMASAIKRAQEGGQFGGVTGGIDKPDKRERPQKPTIGTGVTPAAPVSSGSGAASPFTPLPGPVPSSIGDTDIKASAEAERQKRLGLPTNKAAILRQELMRAVPGVSLGDRLAKAGANQSSLDVAIQAAQQQSGPSLLTPEGQAAWEQEGISRDIAEGIRSIAKAPPTKYGSALGLMPEDYRTKFLEGATRWMGTTVGTLGSLDELLTPGLEKSYLRTVGGAFEEGAAKSAKANPVSETFLGELVAGTGKAVPELIMFGALQKAGLGAALPTVMGARGYKEEGIPGLIKGVAEGMAYHYGGGVTGKYLGKVGNSLIWVGAPAVEDHIVNGTPFGVALGRSLPMGITAGMGGSKNRALVQDPVTGFIREAGVRDLPRVMAGKMTLLEPPQVVQWKQYQQAVKEVEKAFKGDATLSLREKLRDQTGGVGFQFTSKSDVELFKEDHGRLINHPVRRQGFNATNHMFAEDYFNRLKLFARRYAPEMQDMVDLAKDAYENDNLKAATIFSEKALDTIHQGAMHRASHFLVYGRNVGEERGGGQGGFLSLKPKGEPYIGIYNPSRETVQAQKDQTRTALHSDYWAASHEGLGLMDSSSLNRWRYEPKTKTVYWSSEAVGDREAQFAVEDYLAGKGQEVKKHAKLLDYSPSKFRYDDGGQGGFASTGTRKGLKGDYEVVNNAISDPTGEGSFPEWMVRDKKTGEFMAGPYDTQEAAYTAWHNDFIVPPPAPKISRLPKNLQVHLVQMGALHYEAGNRSPDDWLDRMFGSLSDATGARDTIGRREGVDTVSPEVLRQLGEVFTLSKKLYEESTAPTFFSGLRQTIVDGMLGKKIGDKEGRVAPQRLVKYLLDSGQRTELEASGLDQELALRKDKVSLKDIFHWLDTKGMTMDVLRGGSTDSMDIDAEHFIDDWHAVVMPGMRYRVVSEEHIIDDGRIYPTYEAARDAANARNNATWEARKKQQSDQSIIPGALTRQDYVELGGRDYFEGVVYSNKAMDFHADEVHFGTRPDQMSWYRAQLLGGGLELDPVTGDYTRESRLTAKLEEVQAERVRQIRKHGVTKDPGNVHAELIALEQEADITEKELAEVRQRLGKGSSYEDETDQYYRYNTDDDLDAGRAQDLRDEVKLQSKLNKLQARVNDLSAQTTSRMAPPVPWAPHIESWYEPALKGFLREVAERLQPDTNGNVHIVTTSASEQADRYSLKKYLRKVEWTKTSVEDELMRTPFGETPKKSDEPLWDVQITYHHPEQPDRDQYKTLANQTEDQLYRTFGKEISDRITGDKYDFINDGGRVAPPEGFIPGMDEPIHGLDAEGLSIGGEWAPRVYGDTEANIKALWPGRKDLLQYAWRESGNKAMVPAFLEKYFKVWGGKVGPQGEAKTLEEFEAGKSAPRFTATMPEMMRDALLKNGQLFFGKQLPALPNKPEYYAARNRIFTLDNYEAHARALQAKMKLVYNPVTGQRIPDPRSFGRTGGFLQIGQKPKLNKKVITDFGKRVQTDPASFGRVYRSPSKWLASFKDAGADYINERIFDAEVYEHDHTIDFTRRLEGITSLINKAHGIPEREFFVKTQEAFSPTRAQEIKACPDFIDLIEKDLKVKNKKGKEVDNPDRKASNPLIQRALEEHDKLTDDFRTYLMDSYKSRGIHIEDPKNWGITAQGYFRHLFPGENNIFIDGNYHTTKELYIDAIIEANKLQEANPNAKVEIKLRPFQFIDPSVRVSSKNFERLVGDLVGTINKDGEVLIRSGEVRKDLAGKVGKRENISKFLGATLKREGYGGYLKNYEQVMKTHLFQLVRSQELSKLQKDLQPVLDQLRREGKLGIVEGVERHVNDLWGKPLRYEKDFGGLLRSYAPLEFMKTAGSMEILGSEPFRALREAGVNPDLGLEIMVRRIASFHNVFKLKYNPKAIMVNRIQPLRTLWPYLTNKEMANVIRRYENRDPNHPKWRQEMTDLGVMRGAIKLETGQSDVHGLGPKEFLHDPFTYVSGSNRALGYTAGIIKGERDGLTGYALHKEGLRWAAKVEFDNSKWDAPQMLRHSAGQLFGQYKGFMIKDIENTLDIFSKQKGDRFGFTVPKLGFDVSLSKASRVGKWAAGTAVAGGLKAAFSPMAWMGTAAGFSIYVQSAAMIQALTGTDDKTAKAYAAVLFLGPPAAIGEDISSSVTPIDEPQGFTPWEKALRFVSGPTVTGLYDVSTEGRKVVAPAEHDVRPFGERLAGFGAKISPYTRMAQRAVQLEEQLRGNQQYMYVDQHAIPLTISQEAFGIFGVPPSNAALYYEQKEATGKSPFQAPHVTPPFTPTPLSRFRTRKLTGTP